MAQKQNDISGLPNLGIHNMENLFFVDTDEDGNYFYDFTDTLYFDFDDMSRDVYDVYGVKQNDTLYGISNRFYGTPKLWWLIGSSNNIDDPFQLKNMVGEKLNIIRRSYLGDILTLINNN